jgi:hypothetical protein
MLKTGKNIYKKTFSCRLKHHTIASVYITASTGYQQLFFWHMNFDWNGELFLLYGRTLWMKLFSLCIIVGLWCFHAETSSFILINIVSRMSPFLR